MKHSGWQLLTGTSALGAAISAGVFFAFSSFVMRGLGRLPAHQGIGAMQSINRTAVEAPFMIVLNGSVVLAGAAAVHALFQLDEPGSWWAIAGAGLDVLGAWVITGVFNIPRNDALDRLDGQAPGAAAMWTSYLREWTLANHARTALCAAGAVALAFSVVQSRTAVTTEALPALAA